MTEKIKERVGKLEALHLRLRDLNEETKYYIVEFMGRIVDIEKRLDILEKKTFEEKTILEICEEKE